MAPGTRVAFDQHEELSAIVVVSDTDGNPGSLKALEQVADILPITIVIAAPHSDAESWFVAGLVPERGSKEGERLQSLTQALSFDPCQQPHRLTSHPNDAPTDAKRVLRRILYDEGRSAPIEIEELRNVAELCFGDLTLLKQRGAQAGVASFLEQIETLLYPLFLRN